MGRLPLALLAVAVLLAGCGGTDNSDKDPTAQVPATGGLREKVRAAQAVNAADFPAAGGRTLQEVANSAGSAGPELGMASSVFTPGQNRVAFGMIDSKSGFVYGKTALYVAPKPGAKAQGPYPAPADVLLTQGRYRSKQAATEADPFAAVYAAQVPFKKPGKYSILAVTKDGAKTVAAPGQVNVVSKAARPHPRGRRAHAEGADRHQGVGPAATSPRSTRAAARRHAREVVRLRGRQEAGRADHRHAAAVPVARLRPGGRRREQMKSRYGKQVEFIHQEVYKNNDAKQGLRKPLEQLNLATEPWLFVVGKDGRITARLEGSFGISAFKKALNTAL